jgi:hypothetical protein
MGIKYTRVYSVLNDEFAEYLLEVEDLYDFFEMSKEEWNYHNDEDKRSLAKTVADDLFYGLSSENEINVGSAVVSLDNSNEIIKFTYENGSSKILHMN